MGTVTVIGSSNIDLVIKGNALPEAGQTVIGGDFFRAFGGKGANQAVAAARSGADTNFICCVGDDEFGNGMITNFQDDGISVQGVSRDTDNPSGVALIMVDKNGENIISVAPGANSTLKSQHIKENRSLIEQADAVLIQLEIPLDTVYSVISTAHDCGTQVILNPAPAPEEELSKEYLSMVSYITPNRGELELLTDGGPGSDVEDKAVYMLEQGVDNVIVTLGEKGVFYISSDGEKGKVTAPGVQAVDAVGAGDCFSGCFTAFLAEGRSLGEAVAFGVGAAALCVTCRGAQPSMPSRREIEEFMSSRKVIV